MQADEYAAAFGPQARAHNYDPDSYSALAERPVQLLDGDHDVFGDGTVVITRLPGHTIGSQSLLVKLRESGTILVSGDLTHSLENWTAKAIPPVLNYDVDASARSLAQAERLLADNEATLWVQHDLEQYAGLFRSPRGYR